MTAKETNQTMTEFEMTEAIERLKQHGDWRSARQHNIKRWKLSELASIGLARYRVTDLGKFEFRCW